MSVEAEIQSPPEEKFTCGQCNLCCKRGWLIGIDDKEAARLRDLYPDLDPMREVDLPDGRRVFGMARKEDGSCVFLESYGCRIHREHGFEAKPDVCRRFPYFLWKDKNDVAYLHLSRMCPTVYEGRGAFGKQLLDAARPLLPGAKKLDVDRDDPVSLSGAVELNWPGYQQFEDELVALISDERWALDDAVAGGRILLDRFIKQTSGEQSFSRGFSNEDDLALDIIMSTIASRSAMSGLYRYVMAAMVSVIESRRGIEGEKGVWREDFGNFFKIIFGRRELHFRSMRLTADLSRLGSVPWPKKDNPDLSPVRRLLVSHIRRKFLLQAPDIEFGYHLLIGAYAAIKFYSRASAVAHDRETLIPSDLKRGVQATEYNLLLHRTLEGDPLESRFVRNYFKRFLFHPSYPSSMVAF